MKLKIWGAVLFTAIAVTAGWNYSQSKNKMKLTYLALANVEALANGEDQSGKICYYNGTTTCADYIPCTADYPNIGKCGTRTNAYYSKDKGQCRD